MSMTDSSLVRSSSSLRTLVEQWRTVYPSPYTPYHSGVEDGRAACADELAALLSADKGRAIDAQPEVKREALERIHATFRLRLVAISCGARERAQRRRGDGAWGARAEAGLICDELDALLRDELAALLSPVEGRQEKRDTPL